MIYVGLTFVSPFGALFALAVVLPLVAFAVSSARSARVRSVLNLQPPETDRHLALSALAAAPLLLGLAAAGPALRTHVGRRVRTDAEAIFIFDTSRSMAASSGPRAPTRFVQAQAAAIRLRNDAIPEIPAGVASLTTELLPHLFPTPDPASFDSTVENALGVEKPPPPFLQYGVLGSSFGPLTGLRNHGFFNTTTKRRFAILLTDGESGPIAADVIGKALTLPLGYPPPPPPFPGQPATKPEAPVKLIIVRFGGGNDRIYGAEHKIEAAYRPDPRAATIVTTLAAAARGRAFTASRLGAAAAALRQSTGGGSLEGTSTKTVTLAPYVVLVAFLPLGFLIWRRNLTNV